MMDVAKSETFRILLFLMRLFYFFIQIKCNCRALSAKCKKQR